MAHPDALDRLCADGEAVPFSDVLEIRNDAEMRGDVGQVERCERVLVSLIVSHETRRAAA